MAGFILVVLLCGFSNPATAASWNTARDTAMAFKERGQGLQAYSIAAGFKGGSPEDEVDQQFIAGWIALRSLNRSDIALTHFKNMAMACSGLKSTRQGTSKSKAGYWLGRTLKLMGRQADATAMFKASMVYPTTFYGQLSASELKTPLSKTNMKQMAASYPDKTIYWHDKRVRREFVLAIIREESRFNQNANSNKAARGMMQVLDGTAKHVGRDAGVSIDTSMMRSNADYNIAVGSRYLADQMDKFNGNTMLAAAAYNAGPGRADEWLSRYGDPRGGRVDPVDWAESIPFRETRDYVQKVVSSYVTYLALAGK